MLTNNKENIITQCIKSFLNKHNPDCKFNINSKVTKTLYNKLSLHMKIDFVQNKDSDFRIYFLKALLICRGYDCDFNGVYNNSTMRIVKQYKFDNNIVSFGFKIPFAFKSSTGIP